MSQVRCSAVKGDRINQAECAPACHLREPAEVEVLMPPKVFYWQKSTKAKICSILPLCVLITSNLILSEEEGITIRVNVPPEGKGQARSGQHCAYGAGASRFTSEPGSCPTAGVCQPQTPLECPLRALDTLSIRKVSDCN